MRVKYGPLKPRFLPYFIGSKYIDTILEESEDFFKNLPNVCPFCGWIGDNPLQHGYTDDWVCPILWLAVNINLLRSGRYVSEEEININEGQS